MVAIVLICVAIFFGVGCNSTQGREDSFENKSITHLCNADFIAHIFDKNPQVAREMFCMCQEGAKGSDANKCETIINHNNTVSEKIECKDGGDACLRHFRTRK